MAWYDSLGLGGLLASAVTAAGYKDMVGDLQNYGQTAQQEANRIGDRALTASQFRPYTVTTASGGQAGYDTSGNVFQNLGANEANLQRQLLGQAGQMFGQAGQPNAMLGGQASMFGNMLSNYQGSPAQGNINTLASQYAGLAGQAGQNVLQDQGQREQDIYNRIRAAQSPEEQRQQAALEERLAAQGRLGISTNQYGGTPEQLAMEKARAEAQNTAMLSAMQQAGQERSQSLAEAQGLSGLAGNFAQIGSGLGTQDLQNQLALAGGSQQALMQQLGLQQGYGQLGQGMLSSAYVPQAQLLNSLQAGTQIQQLADLGRRQGAQLQAEAGMSGLEAMLQSQLGAGNLTGQGIAALASILGGSTSNTGMFGADDTLKTLFNLGD